MICIKILLTIIILIIQQLKFNGWYTASSGGTKVGGANSSYTPSSDTTLYAQWTAGCEGVNMSKFASSCTSNGGTFSCGNDFANTHGNNLVECEYLSSTSAMSTVTNACDTGKGLYIDGSGGTHGVRLMNGSRYLITICFNKSNAYQAGSSWKYAECSNPNHHAGVTSINFGPYAAVCGDPWQ